MGDTVPAGSVRVRFAPSPTGYLHVGGARTALFNWLLARAEGGTFVLRIEDTDVERSSAEMVTGILDGLRWLGLDWDEGPEVGGPYGPYFQSERLDLYRATAERLVTGGHAYYCYCTPESLQARRDAAQAAGAPRAIRFRVPEGNARFVDLVHGPIDFALEHIEDFVVLRSDRQPTYHLSVVVDDVQMRISHVVRGDDHISNTPKQILLYQALGASTPAFAHVPLILGTDKKRLSKRHGATSVMEYARLGYLTEAMVNFLALLGWSPGTDQEVFTLDELIAAFSLEGISGGNPVFNPDKLDWFNQQHLARLPIHDLARRVEPELRAAGLWCDDFAASRQAWLFSVLELLRPRTRVLPDFVEGARYFLSESIDRDPAAVRKHLSGPDLRDHLSALRAALAGLEPYDVATLEEALRRVATERNIKAATLIHAARVAVTGRSASPGLFEVLALLGRERTLQRLAEAERMAGQFLP